jgi:hypothetical protein
MKKISFAMAAAAALAAGAIPGGFVNTVKAETSAQQGGHATGAKSGQPKADAKAAKRAAVGGGVWHLVPRKERRAGPGWTNRHQQRVAAKRRNVQRNRLAHRGGRK